MLEIKNLSCGYSGKVVLKNATLGIENKDLIGIIGPNGSGKTTLLRAITRIVKPQSGCIEFEGKDIWHTSLNHIAKNIAVVWPSSAFAAMTVEEYILLGRIPYFRKLQFLESKKDSEVVARCMQLTDVDKIKDNLFTNISSGERQLCCIARALAQEPKLLLLDEPTSHLDIAHQVVVLDLVKRLNRELGITVLMVLHDLNLASEYCQKLILLDNGKIARKGAPEDVLTYQNIEEVYKTVVVVEKNPISKKPYILLISEEEKYKVHLRS